MPKAFNVYRKLKLNFYDSFGVELNAKNKFYKPRIAKRLKIHRGITNDDIY